uniref:prefoldin subunit 6-like n=1 Tax=Pristiophorus japonicus TaxID=55135 RepID=UPI00398F72BC
MPGSNSEGNLFRTWAHEVSSTDEIARTSYQFQRIFPSQLLSNSELDLLDAANTIFKLIGPVLVKQDLEEAKSTVAKRLEYISGEIKRYEGQMKELEKKSEQHREPLGKLQQDFQKAQGKVPIKV